MLITGEIIAIIEERIQMGSLDIWDHSLDFRGLFRDLNHAHLLMMGQII